MSNSLKDVEWNYRYSGRNDDLINDFYIPALSKSKYYYRVAGYFRSSALIAAFRGVNAFVESGHKMFFIVGAELTKEDIESIQRGEVQVEDIIFKNWETCKDELKKNNYNSRLDLLAWLVAHDKLEIRIGLNKDKEGNLLRAKESAFHSKILIFEDEQGNKIQLDGSINETWRAWKENRENFCVHKSWVSDQIQYIETAMDEFNILWKRLDNSAEVMPLPEAIRRELIDMVPKHRPEIKDELEFIDKVTKDMIGGVLKENKSLRKYQQEAIDSWKENGFNGILEMATGTGKTFTAIKSFTLLGNDFNLLLVGVPQKELAKQWNIECNNIISRDDKRILECHSDSKGWKDKISRILRQGKREKSLVVLICVYDTMRTKIFQESIKEYVDEKTVMIFDEVHELGSKENRKLLDYFSGSMYRLGLSATPERAWDKKGNDSIKSFFGKTPIFVWDMKKAINPPKGYPKSLSDYKYYIHNASLDEEELLEYEELSRSIRKRVAILTKGGKIPFTLVMDDPLLKKMLLDRAKIQKKCKNKNDVLKYILKNHISELKKCLIYCNDKDHMDEVIRIITKMGLKCLKFFGEMNSEERDNVFYKFAKQDVQFLVAIKCLDQGIDIPIVDSAIILTSSRNPREYVQRRGRILRLHEDKDFSVLHDIFVFPHPFEELKKGLHKLYDFEVSLLENQIERIKIFTENSLNRAENLLSLLDYGKVVEVSSKQNG